MIDIEDMTTQTDIAILPTAPVSVALPKTTKRIPAVQLLNPRPFVEPAITHILGIYQRIDSIQNTLLTRLMLIGYKAQGTLDELQEQLMMPFMEGDLRALYEAGCIKLGCEQGVWIVEVMR